MYADIAELREFYTSPMGEMARRLLRRQVRLMWPSVAGQTVLGFGYATPLLRPFLDEADRVMAFMPAAQGVLPWPREGPVRSVLVDDYALPLQDASVDRIIVMHAFEGAPHLMVLIEELWRVLASGGRLMVVAANRSGLWAQSDATPFGFGSSFSQRQLKKLLRDNLFIPEREASCLFVPPTNRRFWMGMAPLMERVGQKWMRPLAGVHLIEASKQTYAPIGHKTRAGKGYAPSFVPRLAGLGRSGFADKT